MATALQNPRSHNYSLAFGAIFAVALFALAAACKPYSETAVAKQRTEDFEANRIEGEKDLIKIEDFRVYVIEAGVLRDEIRAESAYLHHQQGMARLTGVHVDFHKPGKEEKDTLDAPAGYLYLKEMDVTTSHPFYKAIGGPDAITTPTFELGGRTTGPIHRGEKDVDLIGTITAPIVYLKADGGKVACERAWRHTAGSRLYGVGNCEFVMSRGPNQPPMQVVGAKVTVDDRVASSTKAVRVIGGRIKPRPKGAVQPKAAAPPGKKQIIGRGK